MSLACQELVSLDEVKSDEMKKLSFMGREREQKLARGMVDGTK